MHNLLKRVLLQWVTFKYPTTSSEYFEIWQLHLQANCVRAREHSLQSFGISIIRYVNILVISCFSGSFSTFHALIRDSMIVTVISISAQSNLPLPASALLRRPIIPSKQTIAGPKFAQFPAPSRSFGPGASSYRIDCCRTVWRRR